MSYTFLSDAWYSIPEILKQTGKPYTVENYRHCVDYVKSRHTEYLLKDDGWGIRVRHVNPTPEVCNPTPEQPTPTLKDDSRTNGPTLKQWVELVYATCNVEETPTLVPLTYICATKNPSKKWLLH